LLICYLFSGIKINIMEFDIGNLIFIIATLVAILVSVLGKKKKPVFKEVPPETTSNKQGNFFERMGKELEGYLDMEEKKRTQNTADTVMTQKAQYDYLSDEIKSEPETLMADYEGEFNPVTMHHLDLIEAEGIPSIEPLQVIEIDEEFEERDYFEIIDDFDAEKAIIYSAIINRIDY